MITASQLDPHCGYKRVLRQAHPSKARDRAANLGTLFHQWLPVALKDPRTVTGEPQVDAWLATAVPALAPVVPKDAVWEQPLGLSFAGCYVPVIEPEPHKYQPGEGAEFTTGLMTAGRADLHWMDRVTIPDDILTLVDLKTGAFAVDHPSDNLQLNSLALAAADKYQADRYRCGIYYVRTNFLQWGPVTSVDSPEAANAWAAVEAAATMGEEPRVGAWCQGCWERKNCEAYRGRK